MSRIKHFVRYRLADESIQNSKIKSVENAKSLILQYPCVNETICTPYELTLNPGVYRMECWGSIGQQWCYTEFHLCSKPGLGAYTVGTLLVTEKTKLYVYIGARGPFNSVRNTYKYSGGITGGGATDVRLVQGENWFNQSSLISRIMVAAGGAGAEWGYSIGGNGGTLNGGSGISATSDTGTGVFAEPCEGANQTSGKECRSYKVGETNWPTYKGEFGSAGYIEDSLQNDFGGFGGGGYYGGSSYDLGFAGSGGSSFISGHEGCDSVKSSLPIEHTGNPIHYSGFIFVKTEMISGNETMPLPRGGHGIYNDTKGGAFRIRLISYSNISIQCTKKSRFTMILLTIISLCS